MKASQCLLALVLALVVGCGDGLTAPGVCEQFSGVTVTVFVGEVESVTPCFTSEGEISAVVSSDPEVAAVAIQGDDINIRGRWPGTTSVTVTATNTAGSTDVVIPVVVPNRDPEAISESPNTVRMAIGWDMDFNLATVFRDPDGQALTYTAEASPTGVVDVAIDAATLTITAQMAGTADVRVTATDGAGEASITIPVAVIVQTVLYENDFTEGHDEWSPWTLRDGGETGSKIRTDGGAFELWGTVQAYRGTAIRAMSAEGFDVRARLRPGRDSVDVRLAALVRHPVYYQIEIALAPYGPDDFFVLGANLDGEFEEWASGTIEGGVNADEWIDVRWWWANNQYHVTLNGGQKISFGNASTTSPNMRVLAFMADHFWSGNPGAKVYMDAIEVRGFPTEGDVK